MNRPSCSDSSKTSALPTSARMLKVGEVARVLDISIRQVYRQVQNELLPRPVYFGKRCARWPVEAIEKCLKSKAAESLRGLSRFQ